MAAFDPFLPLARWSHEQVHPPLNIAISEDTHLACVQPYARLLTTRDVEATIDPDGLWFDLAPKPIESFLAAAKKAQNDFQSRIVIGPSG